METLRKAWETWKRIGQAIGDTIARLVLSIFYFTIFLPFGLGMRLWGDPLGIRSRGPATWLARSTDKQEPTLKNSRRL